MSATDVDLLRGTDFVMPLKRVGLLTRSVLEALHAFYRPRRVVMVLPRLEARLLEALLPAWSTGPVQLIAEEDFFLPLATLPQILAQYDDAPERVETGLHREPGWWLQQLIKLGAASQVPDISPVYFCWDADLVPIRRWPLYERPQGDRVHCFAAVLQAEARSAFNSSEYAASMLATCGWAPRQPNGGGTFVTHHMAFHIAVVRDLLAHIGAHMGLELPWPLLLMSLSRRFFRFSEYMTYATFALRRQEGMLRHGAGHCLDGDDDVPIFNYHQLEEFGSGGVRFRDSGDVLRDIVAACGVLDAGVPFERLRRFAVQRWPGDRGGDEDLREGGPGYLQLDRAYGLSLGHPHESHFDHAPDSSAGNECGPLPCRTDAETATVFAATSNHQKKTL